ncbi:uncharacterized protein si:cabz01007807.1 isoform X3 [Amphiprion ocellaris]|uniref:uncharacterized protein si:cabz01007807.1 isoform X3 n=1 Tax=Amphiprion ocellaris TaxID=80972 RepID=UPI0024112DF9|nr:uncharacterized protein si:cabz01007807.1 isoform X3 [Amphiprion ocellaris]
MRGDTATENDVDGDEHGKITAPTDTASGERRPSVVTLQNMLTKVSQSPFHSQYKDGEQAAAATDVTDNQHLGQNGVKEQLHASPQNGSGGNLARTNPFYAYYLESGSQDHILDDAGGKTSEEVHLDAIFVPPPEFQGSPLKNGAKLSETQDHLYGTHNHNQELFQTSTLGQNATTNGHFHDFTLNTPDLFKVVQSQNLSKTLKSKNSDLFKDEMEDLFQAAKGDGLLQTTSAKEVFDKSASILVDPFESPSNKEDDLFRSPQPTTTNPFYTSTNKEADLFQAVPTTGAKLFNDKEITRDPATTEKDLFGISVKEKLGAFSSPSTSTGDPFPNSVTRNLFQNISSLDGTTPTKQYDPFQEVSSGTPDIFQSLPSKTNSEDLFETTPNIIASKSTYSTSSLNSPSDVKSDTLLSPDLFKKTPPRPPPPVPPKPFHKPREIVLTTPRGTEHEILQSTPLSQGSDVSASPSPSPAEMTHVPTFKRPPKPLPRTRPPRPEKLPKPERPPQPVIPIEPQPNVPKTPPKPALRPLQKPVIRRKLKPQENKPVDPDNYVVFENILLIGQERCVEDWPEDSPELNPDFKPSGKLRLRRESLKTKADSDGGSGDDQDGNNKKKDKKFRMSLLSRRGSKDKFPDDTKEGRSRTLSIPRKSSKDYFSDVHMSEDEERNSLDYKKNPLKTKVNQLLRRASTASSVVEGKHVNGYSPQESKDGDIDKKSSGKKDSIRRWSEGTVLDDSTGEEEGGGEAQHEEKTKKRMKIKFVPHRGFTISVEKKSDEPKGAHGYSPRKGSKEKSPDEVFGAHGYTPRKKSQDDASEHVEEAAFMDDEHLQRTNYFSPGLNGDEEAYGMQDCKPKKPTKKKLPHMARRSSKENMLDDASPQKKKSSFSGEELDIEDLNAMEGCKPKSLKHKAIPVPRKPNPANGQNEPTGLSYNIPQQASSDLFAEEAVTGKDFMDPEMYDSEQDELDSCKPKKTSKLKGFKKYKAKIKAMQLEGEDPPGATSSDYLSEAAQAEWLAAQMDERAIAGMEDDDEEGDTDSLMEWWYTVEQWDELPSDDEDIKEDESKSFTILADKVHRGLRVFNKVFTERAEVLWQSIIMLHAIADDISEFHHKAKIAGITGGTTTAVGGVTAIAGLALAPFTFGASLVITAVGVGVATAGGITSASAAISDNVNNMHDRKKVETVLQDYENHLLDIGKILHFINQGLYKLRGHPFLRSGTQHYSEDWEIRRAVQMISLVDSPVMRATEITDAAVASLQGLFKGMDKYFIKDSRELKKGCKKEMVGQIKEVANMLNDDIVELNTIREELQDATGSM